MSNGWTRPPRATLLLSPRHPSTRERESPRGLPPPTQHGGREQPWGLPSDPEIRLQDRERLPCGHGTANRARMGNPTIRPPSRRGGRKAPPGLDFAPPSPPMAGGAPWGPRPSTKTPPHQLQIGRRRQRLPLSVPNREPAGERRRLGRWCPLHRAGAEPVENGLRKTCRHPGCQVPGGGAGFHPADSDSALRPSGLDLGPSADGRATLCGPM